MESNPLEDDRCRMSSPFMSVYVELFVGPIANLKGKKGFKRARIQITKMSSSPQTQKEMSGVPPDRHAISSIPNRQT